MNIKSEFWKKAVEEATERPGKILDVNRILDASFVQRRSGLWAVRMARGRLYGEYSCRDAAAEIYFKHHFYFERFFPIHGRPSKDAARHEIPAPKYHRIT